MRLHYEEGAASKCTSPISEASGRPFGSTEPILILPIGSIVFSSANARSYTVGPTGILMMNAGINVSRVPNCVGEVKHAPQRTPS